MNIPEREYSLSDQYVALKMARLPEELEILGIRQMILKAALEGLCPDRINFELQVADNVLPKPKQLPT